MRREKDVRKDGKDGKGDGKEEVKPADGKAAEAKAADQKEPEQKADDEPAAADGDDAPEAPQAFDDDGNPIAQPPRETPMQKQARLKAEAADDAAAADASLGDFTAVTEV